MTWCLSYCIVSAVQFVAKVLLSFFGSVCSSSRGIRFVFLPFALAVLIAAAFTVAALYWVSGHDHEWVLNILKCCCAFEPTSLCANIVRLVHPKCVTLCMLCYAPRFGVSPACLHDLSAWWVVAIAAVWYISVQWNCKGTEGEEVAIFLLHCMGARFREEKKKYRYKKIFDYCKRGM